MCSNQYICRCFGKILLPLCRCFGKILLPLLFDDFQRRAIPLLAKFDQVPWCDYVIIDHKGISADSVGLQRTCGVTHAIGQFIVQLK